MMKLMQYLLYLQASAPNRMNPGVKIFNSGYPGYLGRNFFRGYYYWNSIPIEAKVRVLRDESRSARSTAAQYVPGRSEKSCRKTGLFHLRGRCCFS